MNEEIFETYVKNYKLEESATSKYLKYLQNLCFGDFGVSFVYKEKKVLDIILDCIPISCSIGLISSLIAIISGLVLGCFTAIKSNIISKFISKFFHLIICLPSFVIFIVLQYLFCVHLEICSLVCTEDLTSYCLPIICLALHPCAVVFSIMQKNIHQILQMEYILAAKAKGLPMRKIILSHVLKNAVIPTFSYSIPLFSSILTGSMIIEKLFAIPGSGNLLIASLQSRDLPTLYALSLILCGIFIFIATISDLWSMPHHSSSDSV